MEKNESASCDQSQDGRKMVASVKKGGTENEDRY